jgi:DNA invertase Pin-like site-specific DNA recombinase
VQIEMRRIGYARVSSAHQNLDRQIAALRAERVHVIFREKASGKSTKGRPELEKAIDELRTGDVLVLAEWDRCTRSMSDGIGIVERVHKRGAFVKVLDRDYLDLTKPINRGILAFLSALAEDERHRIVRRANEGRTAARKRGTKFGRKPKLTEYQQGEVRTRLTGGESCRQIARTFGVHHSTVSRPEMVASSHWRIAAALYLALFHGIGARSPHAAPRGYLPSVDLQKNVLTGVTKRE